MAKEAPYGSWESPISSEEIVKEKTRLGTVHVFNEEIYWIEGRPKEKGRNALRSENTKDAIPNTFNIRTRVHEYGGNCYVVVEDTIYFSNFSDNGLYKQGVETVKLSTDKNLRFADPIWNAKAKQLIFVCEEHGKEKEPENYLATYREGKGIQKLISGHDFYSSPVINPDGTKLAWIAWNHPNMPWDESELWIADIVEGHLKNPTMIVGGKDISLQEPKWSPEGELYFISDKSGWWNIYRFKKDEVEAMLPMAADFGIPRWLFGMNRYAFISGSKEILCVFTENGVDHLGKIDLTQKKLTRIETPFTTIRELDVGKDFAAFLGSNAQMHPSVIKWDIPSGSYDTIYASGVLDIDPSYISKPETIEFPTEGGKTAFALYYPPTNPEYRSNEKPPLIVLSHGGPTAHVNDTLDLTKQFFTTRGFAIVDVNYGGSTGFGRNYRERLISNWGIVDVDDCVNAAQYLADKGLADANRMAISGGSAGGYTTLAALAFRDVFKAGASYYGISDLTALAEFTHKFEGRYSDKLVGPYPSRKDLYDNRSPINHVDKLSCPIILLQGDEDKIVPPEQSEMMYNSLLKKGIPTAYLLFENEQHGFRGAENIKKATEAEYYFYSQIFGFTPTEDITPIEIKNL